MLEIFVKCTNYEAFRFPASPSFVTAETQLTTSRVVHVGIAKDEIAIKHGVFLLLPVVISPLLHTNLSSRLGTTAQFVAAVPSHSTTTTNCSLPCVEISSVFCISSF
jgi:hypothetical protein